MDMKKPVHIEPESRNYKDYFDHIKAYNAALHTEIEKLLAVALAGLDNGFSIGTIGSDGRLEKGPGSLVEVIQFCDGSARLGVREILESMVTEDNRNIFEPRIERKNITTDSMSESTITFADNEVKLISPNRVFDTHFLYGNEETHVRAKQKLAEQLVSSRAKGVYEKIGDKVRQHRKITETGMQSYKGDPIQHYDISQGVATYDPKRGLWSFKQGPLRYAQFVLVRDQIRTIRDGSANAVLMLPTNTVDKMNAIEVQGMSQVPSENFADAADCYKFFLWQYHRSQAAHKKGQQTIMYDGKEAKERCNALIKICSERLIQPYSGN